MDVKKPTTFEQQLKLLKSRGCIVENDEACVHVLNKVNYYRLSAYLLPFKDGNKYKKETSFEVVYKIYEFDRKLRSILLSVLEEFELYLRTQLSYFHSHKYGALGYMNAENFSKKHNHYEFIKRVKKEIKHNKTTLIAVHHESIYGGRYPLWVIIDWFNFGMLASFFKDLKRTDQIELSNHVFYSKNNYINSWLKCITDLRNICAHYGRVYYRRLPSVPKIPDEVKYKLSGKLFDSILALKWMFFDVRSWNISFITSLEHLFEEYEDVVKLSSIGFPDDWKKILRK